jgi:hypothetical protein
LVLLCFPRVVNNWEKISVDYIDIFPELSITGKKLGRLNLLIYITYLAYLSIFPSFWPKTKLLFLFFFVYNYLSGLFLGKLASLLTYFFRKFLVPKTYINQPFNREPWAVYRFTPLLTPYPTQTGTIPSDTQHGTRAYSLKPTCYEFFKLVVE